MLEVDLRRNVSADIVILINRGTFRGHDGVRELARIVGEAYASMTATVWPAPV